MINSAHSLHNLKAPILNQFSLRELKRKKFYKKKKPQIFTRSVIRKQVL